MKAPQAGFQRPLPCPVQLKSKEIKELPLGQKTYSYSSSLETVWTFKVRSAAETCGSGVNGSQMGSEEDINVTIRKTLEIRCTKKRS